MPPKKSESTEDHGKNIQPEKAENNSCKNSAIELGTTIQISKRKTHENTLNIFTILHKNLSTSQMEASQKLKQSSKEILNYDRLGEKGEDRYNTCERKVMQYCI